MIDARAHSSACLCGTRSTILSAEGLWLTPSQVYAQSRHLVEKIRQAAATEPIAVHHLRSGISVLQGSGGNIGALTGPDGILLVDAGIAVSQPRLAEALASLSDQPIRHLINTHWHFDHADGNAWVHAAGAVITAHEKTRDRLTSAQRVEDWATDFPAPPTSALPTELFSTSKQMVFNGQTIDMAYYGAAHTDCDISVAFPDADILHTGDTFWNGIYPFTDYSTGGSIDGAIRAAEANLSLATDTTIVIPGHGPIGNRAQLVEFRDMLVGTRAAVAALKDQGLSLEAIIAANPTAPFDAKWGQFVIDPALYTFLVHEGL